MPDNDERSPTSRDNVRLKSERFIIFVSDRNSMYSAAELSVSQRRVQGSHAAQFLPAQCVPDLRAVSR